MNALKLRVVLGVVVGGFVLTGCEDPAATGDVVDDVADTVGDGADGADTVTPPPANPLFDPAGEIGVVEHYSTADGAVVASEVSARLFSAPQPNLQQFVREVGDCQLWVRPVALCDPPCNAFTEACVPGPRCEALPEGRSAGGISISGANAGIALTYAGQGLYYAEQDPPADVFSPGATLEVSAAGAEIAAFSAAVRGVGDLGDSFAPIALVDGETATVNWVPAGDGAQVELVLQLGWHANPPEAVIYCQAPDSAGSIVVASEIVNDFPYFEGMGLFQVPSWVQRVSRQTVATAAGQVAVFAASRQAVSVTHQAQ